jgi:hypothetical protein
MLFVSWGIGYRMWVVLIDGVPEGTIGRGACAASQGVAESVSDAAAFRGQGDERTCPR